MEGRDHEPHTRGHDPDLGAEKCPLL